jgi:hypothetical protein
MPEKPLQRASEVAKRLANRCNSGDIVTSPSLPTPAVLEDLQCQDLP